MCAKHLSQSLPPSNGQTQAVIFGIYCHREVGSTVDVQREEGVSLLITISWF